MKRTRQAIALEYGENNAPVLVAKGHDALAQRIVEEAQKQGVYVAQDAELVAMLSRLDLDQEIPPTLYKTVAVILAWAYWLKGMQPGDEKRP